MREARLEKRHCRRLKLKEKYTVQIGNETIEVEMLELSPKGALVECQNGVRLPSNEVLTLSVKPDNSVDILHFKGEVVHYNKNLAGVSFSPIAQ